MKKMVRTLILLFLFIGNTNTSFSQSPGDLYLPFGINGISTYDYLGHDQVAWDIAVQEDDKMLVVGNSGSDILVVRYMPNGSLDESFGDSGKRIIDLGEHEIATCVDIDSNGDIMVGGLMGWEDSFLIRLLPDGSMDASFGLDGVLEIYAGISAIEDLTILPDHKIIVAGWEYSGDLIIGAVLKVNPIGTIYEDFGEDGYVYLDYTTEDKSIDLQGIAITTDSKILVSGGSSSAYNQIVVASFNEDGTTNEGFGVEGVVFYGMPAENTFLGAMLLDNEGRIIIGAEFTPGKSGLDRDMKFFRLMPGGGLDYSFNDGELIINMGSTANEFVSSILLEDDGKYVVGGSANSDFLLLRINEDGTLDEDFGTDGIVQTDIFGGDDVVYSMGLQSDMNIVAAGKAFFVTAEDYDFTLAKYYSGLFAGVNEIWEQEYDLSIYPNPATDNFEIKLSENYNGKAKALIYNAMGEMVVCKNLSINNSVSKIQNLGLNDGIYFLELRTKDAVIKSKLIITTN